jgi:hypothetical protein
MERQVGTFLAAMISPGNPARKNNYLKSSSTPYISPDLHILFPFYLQTAKSFFSIVLLPCKKSVTMFDYSGKVLVALITLACSIGFMLFGYDQGVLSGLIGAENQFGQDFNNPDPTTQGLIVSVYQLGNVGGSIVIFLVGDKLGRKNSIIWSTVVMLIGAILQTAAINRGMMYAGRIITGFVSYALPLSVERNDVNKDRETEEILLLFQCGRRRPALPRIVGNSSPSTHVLSSSEF